MKRMRRVAGAVGVVLVMGSGGPAGAVPQPLLLERSRVEVAVTGNSVVPVRLAKAAVWDLSSNNGGVAGVTVDRGQVVLGEHDEFGVALVRGGETVDFAAAVMYAPDGTAVLASGHTSASGPLGAVYEPVGCVRCEIPAGDYQLFVFGPPRRTIDQPVLRLTVHLEGLADGLTEVGDGGGRAYVVTAAARHRGSAGSTAGGIWMGAVTPTPGRGEHHGVLLSQATVGSSSDRLAVGELRVSEQVNNRPEIGATGEGVPLQDGYAASAGAVSGPERLEARTIAGGVLDRDRALLAAQGDLSLVNQDGWTMDLAMLWLTTYQLIYDEPSSAREPIPAVEAWSR